ncbi:MAG: cytochrome ubiquinol oxidase subunit I [Spirochaetae bacterium HGW-Spirochaetae-1]|jgi:cytochrome d ubiquinol oxidase subunit I|nr:MAG: cytochrome ubiquinol oxidase subunit I [Spirochaetae bacterium HGW-Spirochaetae-1]
MDAVLLSRIQFGFVAGFHFLFPPLTFGLTFIIFLLESFHLKNGNNQYEKISSFLVKILALVFTMGVATGIVLEFSFGTNWSEYSRMVGDIFGAPLAAEGVFSFFLESVFLAVLVFGKKKVTQKVYWLSAFLVFFAAHLSGFWIIIANSWMQTPAGFKFEGGRAVLTSFFDAAFNPSTIIRYVHVVAAAWLTGSLFVAGISAWYLVKDKYREHFQPLLKLSLIIFIAMALLQFATGHMHAVQVARTQPEKMASFEALWKTQKGAPMSLIGIPDEDVGKTYLEIKIPKLLSLLIHFNSDAEVKGLNEFREDERPPVFITYMTYHFMIGLGSLFAAIAMIGALLMATGRLYSMKWFLWTLVITSPLPLLANEFGWMAAEIGRQPWAVYKILRTADAASVVVPAWQILFSLALFGIIYLLLFLVFLKIFFDLIKKGPEDITQRTY